MDTAVYLNRVKMEREHFLLGPLQLEIPRGYISAIVGPNGSGKSSTFQLMLRIYNPDSGQIELFGEQLTNEEIEVALKQRIGYLPEEANDMESWMTGSEKADFIKFWYPTWNVNRYSDLIRIFEVDPKLKLGKMSKGMRRKFDLAVVLAHNPELLLLDEPSSGLDPISWKRMIEILQKYMEEENRTILMATHIIDEVKRLADYIIFMAGGRILGFYEKDELMGNWHAFFVREQGDVGKHRLREVPGFERLEDMGGGFIRIISSNAGLAEKWFQEEGISVSGQNSLELDDILEVLIETKASF
ncbi:ABC transporter ATP-binding protein [Paenibacillus sp. GCM10012307]|uniref:ABC transporter ATP-binding protein n=1 Tax=Paenibacillus roseus TaxID=2798579 RepID=A0A934MQ71_9BACL|nr:ABC transporter ATP-binding protein [Paenibacillus roseus]MBJ6362846.1 ABC transporter ATP-binding protein [Paenibacillus roseus]